MTENARFPQQSRADAAQNDGDCAADPVPALWYQDDDEYLAEAGIIDRFWLPLVVAVILGWGSISYVLFNVFGWPVIVAIAAIVGAGTAAAVVLVRTGERGTVEMPVSLPAATPLEIPEEQHYSKAA